MSSPRQRSLVAAAVVFLAIAGILVERCVWKGRLRDGASSNDFRAYHLAAQGVLHGDLIPAYEDAVRPFLYPPTFAILVAPLGLLPYNAALVVWAVGSGALLVYVFRCLGRILAIPLPAMAGMAGLLLVLRPLESDFSNGNANLLVLAMVLGAFHWSRARGDLGGGAILALAVTAKVTPILVLPWALYRRRWRFVAGFVLGVALLGIALPAAALGPKGASDAWQVWSRKTIGHLDPSSASYAAETASGYEPGQSLRAFVHRLLRRSDATAHDEEVRSIHVVDLPKAWADVAYLCLGAAILACALAACWTRAPGVRLGWRAEEIAAACASMVLLAPLSRKAHFVALWPAAAMGFEAWRLSATPRLRSVGSALWLTALFLIVFTSPDIMGRGAATTMLAYCPFAWASLLLLALVTWPGFFPAGLRRRSVLPDAGADGVAPDRPARALDG